MQIDHHGKTVIVTGAGSGIGAASARRFAACGAQVVVNDIDPLRAEQTAAAIRQAGGQALVYAGDVTDADQVDALVAFAVQATGRLDTLFNNAGGALPTPMAQIDRAEFKRLMALNFEAAYYGTVAALPVMLAQGGGCILCTSSGASLGAVPGLAVYGSAKSALNSLMRSVAVEYGRQGIRANTIAPGAMATPALTGWLETRPGGVAAYHQAQPSGRLGLPEEIADTAVYLASAHASFINGAVIPVDGAVHALLASPQ